MSGPETILDNPMLVDIGLNLTNKRFDHDRNEVIDAAIAAGVCKMIITGTSQHESEEAVSLAKARPGILYSTAGCHPHDASDFDEAALATVRELAKSPEVVAIGECGLDFNRNFSPRDEQIKAFTQQLELAAECGKPVFLHERDAFDTQHQILKDFMPSLTGAVAHCFTGEPAHMQAYLELGLSIGITGWICDERRGQQLYNIVHHIPDDRLMLETDAPYLTPRDLRPKPKGGRNAPAFLPHIAQTVAIARQQATEEVAANSYRNSVELFNLV